SSATRVSSKLPFVGQQHCFMQDIRLEAGCVESRIPLDSAAQQLLRNSERIWLERDGVLPPLHATPLIYHKGDYQMIRDSALRLLLGRTRRASLVRCRGDVVIGTPVGPSENCPIVWPWGKSRLVGSPIATASSGKSSSCGGIGDRSLE